MKNQALTNLVIILFLGFISLPSQAQITNNLEENNKILGGFNYQVQEFQLLNQQVGDDCNCLEASRLNKRSIQSFNLSILKLAQNWAWSVALGYGAGYAMGDDKQYYSRKSLQTRVDLFYHFLKAENRLRPFAGAGVQWAVNANKSLISIPVGAGLRYRLAGKTYLHWQTAYDRGLGSSLTQNLITQLGVHFNLGKSKKRPESTVAEPIVPDATAALTQNNPAAETAKTNVAVADAVKPAESPLNTNQPAQSAASGLAVNQDTPSDKSTANSQSTQVQAQVQLAKVVYFDTDQSSLSKSGTMQTLMEVISFAKNYSNTQILLSGHTDNVLDQAYNLALSKRRVDAVKQWLLQQGIEASRIKIAYSGKASPANTNDTPEGRAANRRVEIIIK